MTNKSINPFLLLVLFGLSLFSAPGAYAHTIIGSLESLSGASATDLYQVECFTDGGGVTDHLEISIRDLTPGSGQLNVTGYKLSNLHARGGTDPKTGDNQASPVIRVPGGSGGYLIFVTRTAAGARKFYELVFHCTAATGTHTGTDSVRFQNQ